MAPTTVLYAQLTTTLVYLKIFAIIIPKCVVLVNVQQINIPVRLGRY